MKTKPIPCIFGVFPRIYVLRGKPFSSYYVVIMNVCPHRSTIRGRKSAGGLMEPLSPVRFLTRCFVFSVTIVEVKCCLFSTFAGHAVIGMYMLLP